MSYLHLHSIAFWEYKTVKSKQVAKLFLVSSNVSMISLLKSSSNLITDKLANSKKMGSVWSFPFDKLAILSVRLSMNKNHRTHTLSLHSIYQWKCTLPFNLVTNWNLHRQYIVSLRHHFFLIYSIRSTADKLIIEAATESV